MMALTWYNVTSHQRATTEVASFKPAPLAALSATMKPFITVLVTLSHEIICQHRKSRRFRVPSAYHQNNPKRSFADNTLALPSSLYWAWTILALLYPLQFRGTQINLSEYELYLIVCVVAGGITALSSYKHSEIALRFLSSLKTELTVVGIASLGAALMLIGIYVHNLILLLIAGVVIGPTNMCFLLAWGRMYAKRGSRTSSVALTLALAIGTAIAGLVALLPFPIAATCIVIMPVAIVGLLKLILSVITASREEDEESIAQQRASIGGSPLLTEPENEDDAARSIEKIFRQTSHFILGMSPSLVLAGIFVGICAGFFNGQVLSLYTATSSSEPFASLSFIAPSLIMLALWAVVFFAPRIASAALGAVIMMGLAGYLWFPAAELAGVPALACALMLVGLVGMFIAIWLTTTELSYQIKNDITVGLGASVASMALGAAVGSVAYVLVGFLSVPLLYQNLILGTMGLLYACSILLLFVGNSELWSLVRTNAFMAAQSSSADHDNVTEFRPDFANKIERIAEEHNLTKREKEVLTLILMGRSRPRIAQILVLSENTVSSHIQHIYRKFGVHSNQELLDYFLSAKQPNIR